MESLLSDLQGRSYLVYLDNIVIFVLRFYKRIERLRAVYELIQSARLFLVGGRRVVAQRHRRVSACRLSRSELPSLCWCTKQTPGACRHFISAIALLGSFLYNAMPATRLLSGVLIKCPRKYVTTANRKLQLRQHSRVGSREMMLRRML